MSGEPGMWPTPEQFVAEWEQLSPESRLTRATLLIEGAQEAERLRRVVARVDAEIATHRVLRVTRKESQ